MKLYAFEVEGTGMFPLDMLRYDCCWPTQEKQTNTFLRDHNHTKVKIYLTGVRAPTLERWRSFGWSVTGSRTN